MEGWRGDEGGFGGAVEEFFDKIISRVCLYVRRVDSWKDWFVEV